MKNIRFGERQSLTDKARQPLSQRVVPTFHVGRLATLFAYATVGGRWDNLLVRLPEITEGQTPFILVRDLVPQAATGLLAAVPDDKSDNLAGTPTNGGPQPAFLTLFQHKRPEFIQFQDIIRLSWQESILRLPLKLRLGSERVTKFLVR